MKSVPWLILGQQQGSPGAEQLLSSTGGQAVGWFILPQEKYSKFLQSAGETLTGEDGGWGAEPKQLHGDVEVVRECCVGKVWASLTYLGC